MAPPFLLLPDLRVRKPGSTDVTDGIDVQDGYNVPLMGFVISLTPGSESNPNSFEDLNWLPRFSVTQGARCKHSVANEA
jgi:hypothetical protein